MSYVYDYQGNRVQQTANTEVTKFVWDTLSRYGDVVAETEDDGTLTTAYTLAMGHVLAQHSTTDHYLLEDVHSSTRLLTDSAATILTSFDYDAYGQLTAQNGTVETKYLYNGQQYDEVLQLYSLRARYYNPLQGRFLSRDKHTGNYANELNRYVYTANNPVMFGDPSGMFAGYGGANTNSAKSSGGLRTMAKAIQNPVLKGMISGALGYVLGISLRDYERYGTVGVTLSEVGLFNAMVSGIFFELANLATDSVLKGLMGLRKNTKAAQSMTGLHRMELRAASYAVAGIAAGAATDIFSGFTSIVEEMINNVREKGYIGWLIELEYAFREGNNSGSTAASGAILNTIGSFITNDRAATLFSIFADTYFNYKPLVE